MIRVFITSCEYTNINYIDFVIISSLRKQHNEGNLDIVFDEFIKTIDFKKPAKECLLKG